MNADVPSLALRRATDADIDFIMRVERLPGYDAVVGRWERAVHEETLANPDNAYLIAPGGAEPLAFAIVMELNDPRGDAYLKRIAVVNPGAGFGTRFLNAVTDWLFLETSALRFQLNVMPHNERAIRLYQRCGFGDDGERESITRADGTRVEMLSMSIRRDEWAARRAV